MVNLYCLENNPRYFFDLDLGGLICHCHVTNTNSNQFLHLMSASTLFFLPQDFDMDRYALHQIMCLNSLKFISGLPVWPPPRRHVPGQSQRPRNIKMRETLFFGTYYLGSNPNSKQAQFLFFIYPIPPLNQCWQTFHTWSATFRFV